MLDKRDIPKKWFNVLPILPEPIPPLKEPNDGKSRIEVMKQIRIKELQTQDKSTEEWINIPQDVIEKYISIGRPTELMRAKALEEYLGTPAEIYLKREDLLPTGSFKLNTAIPQAYYAKRENVKGLVSETGAGQWGVGLAYACNIYKLDCVIFWVKVSLEQKIERATYAEMLGAKIFPSPSSLTKAGREILSKDPTNYGSLGTAIGEAISMAMENNHLKYVSGSNLPHVFLHQTIIGLETKAQLTLIDKTPDMLIACVGGGSNFGGFIAPFLPDKIKRGENLRLIAAESEAAPRLTKGEYRYDHADPVGLTPLVLSYTLGMNYMPPPVHVGGLRQHSGSPIIGVLMHNKLIEAYAYSQEEVFKAGQKFIQCEKIIPAPETCHAIRAAIDFALEAKRKREKRVIVVCLSGNGLLDLKGYKEVLGN